MPADVDVVMDCVNNEAVVSWNASQGALSYMVVAHNKLGDLSPCETAGLTCTLTNLTCGQTYLVQISAQDDFCSSLPSAVTEFKSGKTGGIIFIYLLVSYLTALSTSDSHTLHFSPPLTQFPAHPELAQWFWTASPTRPSWTGPSQRVPWSTPQLPGPLAAIFLPATPTSPTASCWTCSAVRPIMWLSLPPTRTAAAPQAPGCRWNQVSS